MKKIELKICVGTMCYVMGGAELRDTLENLPNEIKQHLDVSFSTCLGYCDKMKDPPYVELNGRMIAGASKLSLIQVLKEEIRNVI